MEAAILRAYSLGVKRYASLLLALLSVAASAQNKPTPPSDQCRKTLRISEFLLPEDAIAAERAFESFRTALLTRNREQVIAQVDLPADFVIDGRGVKIGTVAELAAKYDRLFTPFVIESVRLQNAGELVAGWNGVSLSNGAVTFAGSENGAFRVSDVRPKPVVLTGFAADFMDRRLTCPPLVVEGRIVAYNWVSHKSPGFENIYADHFIVEVTKVLAGALTRRRIRVDFWGVSHLPQYNLPERAFEPGWVWRMYLRPANQPPANEEVCRGDVQETISFVDESGKEVEKRSAIAVLTGEDTPTYAGLTCFEAHKQFFTGKSDDSLKQAMPSREY